MSTTTISVTGENPYDIAIGRGILDRVSEALDPGVRKVLVVHPPTLAARAAELRDRLLADVENGQREVLLAEVPDAEQGKRVEVAAFCWQVMGQADFTRSDAVVGYGGGAVTDLAGFVAATWLRGCSSSRCPPPCSASWTHRWAARPGSTPPRARTSSALSGHLAR